jgi:hypothetical protein
MMKSYFPHKRLCCQARRRKFAMLAVILVVCAAAPSLAQVVSDRVRTQRGAELGEIAEMSPTEVRVHKRPSGTATVQVNEIRGISFDDEPTELNQARVKASNGAYEDAAALLSKINLSTVKRDLIKQDVEFYQAYCAAKLALGGKGTINDAGRQLSAFVRTYPKNYHYYEAVQAMGDLLVADGKLDLAQRQYNDLAAAPWPEYRSRAAVLIGQALQTQGKHAEAIRQFDTALQTVGTDAQKEKLTVTLGKAISLAETGELDASVQMVRANGGTGDPRRGSRAKGIARPRVQRAGQLLSAGRQVQGGLVGVSARRCAV